MSARRLGGGLAVLAAAAVFPDAASAHGLVGKQDLPIPQWLFAWAASVVLIASFVALATLWAEPRLQVLQERRLAALPRALEVLAGAAGVTAFAFVVYAGLAGAQEATANVNPTVIYVLFWVGIPFGSALFGDIFRAFNPWLAVAKAAGWVLRQAGRAPRHRTYPERLGRWPAVAGVLAFAWVELVYVDKDVPSQLAWMAIAYAAIQLAGMAVFGVRPWADRADPFGVYFGMFARISPLHWRDRAVYWRLPLAGAPPLHTVPGTVALLCTMIGTTSFDGFSQGAAWRELARWLQTPVGDLRLGVRASSEVIGTIGLLAMVGLISGLYRLGAAGMHDVDRRHPTGELATRFAHTLVPIALAYVVAHYFSLLAYQGQAMDYLVSDPLGRGSNYFGTASAGIDYNWITVTGIWYVQVGALVLGHVAGLTLAHDRALATYSEPRAATRSQYWMLAVMVAFTSLGLWLLSATGS
jgi:hypothetical protein